MTRIGRTAALLLAAISLDIAGSAGALASLDNRPRVETNCMRSRTVLRPEFGSSLADLQPGEKMPLVQMRLCSFTRRTCVSNGEEVPLSQCAARDEPELSGTLTTE